ncbi:serine hydrolase domain-containing protein [Blastopirellula marina]|uniref:Beta-lactamase-related domain-containing protein n=1 Tax=Blastopirellula marina TaxID=124 RepID=A0A2S8F6J8_9BACT|nr:serine hydrolase domain-containing protein [Blastopirellula marina]PQO27775.1 hypothetical protein C5Y98_27165 [Blastopirellula marina]PTL41515.1 hypothetical protein C5Y97_27180 [Blastopirellula marina]
MNISLRLLVSLFLLLAITVFISPAAAQMPVAGKPAPELAELDQAMLDFMKENDISAGSLSVMKDGKIVLHHTYGWQDEQRQVPIREDAMFRVASVTKPFTAAAIRKLIRDGQISLDSKVFRLAGSDEGLLDFQPLGKPDPRLKEITIDHLLHHRGGWDRDMVGDLTYREKEIAQAFGVASPPGREKTVRYVMGQPLQHDPGAKYAYSNIGFLLLGLIVEKVSGQSYQQFVQQHVMQPAGNSTNDWLLGRTFKSDQDPREPYYDNDDVVENVFYPAHSKQPHVKKPYGGFEVEARTSQGRIVASGVAVLRFLDRYQVNGPNIGGPRPAPGNWKWNHGGSLPGTNAVARQRGDGINFVVLFNKRPNNGNFAMTMRGKLDEIFDGGKVLSGN